MSLEAVQWIEIVLAVVLTAIILLQVRGSGATLFGQADGSFRSRRGVEKVLFRATVALGVVFVLLGAVAISSWVS